MPPTKDQQPQRRLTKDQRRALRWAAQQGRTVSCPNTTESGCRCPNHHPGLTAITRPTNRTPLTQQLQHLAEPTPQTVTLHVLTTDPQPPDNLVELPRQPQPCDGTYNCTCATCNKDRAQRVNTGTRQMRQPWQPRKAA